MPIHGMTYKGKQNEYQYFPEDYFSGSDINLYFEDLFVDDVQALEFGLQEKVNPVYGYNSYTFDAAPRGQRIVQGSFTVLFKEAGYLYSILEHIGELNEKARPSIAYYLGGQTDKDRPTWLAGSKETVEELMDRQAGSSEEQTATPGNSTPKWSTLSLGSSGDDVREFTRWLDSERSGSRYKGIYLINPSSSNGKTTYKLGSKSDAVRVFKSRLNTYLVDSGAKLIKEKLNLSTTYDSATVAAVKVFQKHFSKSLAVDGMIGPKTAAVLDQGFSVRNTIEAPEKLAIMMFQKGNNLAVDGILGTKTMSKMSVSVAPTKETLYAGAEGSFATYEASIWGDQSTNDTNFKNTPFFYSSKKQQNLRIDGFDIFINYGELPADMEGNDKAAAVVDYNTTVRAIRNVQLTGFQQVLSPTGEAIGERYSFIAKDID